MVAEMTDTEDQFDQEFPRDGHIIKEIRKELKNDFDYNSKRIA